MPARFNTIINGSSKIQVEMSHDVENPAVTTSIRDLCYPVDQVVVAINNRRRESYASWAGGRSGTPIEVIHMGTDALITFSAQDMLWETVKELIWFQTGQIEIANAAEAQLLDPLPGVPLPPGRAIFKDHGDHPTRAGRTWIVDVEAGAVDADVRRYFRTIIRSENLQEPLDFPQCELLSPLNVPLLNAESEIAFAIRAYQPVTGGARTAGAEVDLTYGNLYNIAATPAPSTP